LSAPPPSHALSPSKPVLLRLVDLQQRDTIRALAEPEWLELQPPASSGTGPVRPPSAEQATAMVTAMVRALLEVLEGRRPPRQLSPVLRPEVLDRLETLLSLGVRRISQDGLRLYKVRVCLPHPAVIEGCAVVRAGHRYRALALRMEYGLPRWTCTALRVG
jgi:hypothetical protein